MIVATRKVHFSYVPLGGDGGVGESWLLTHAWQIGRSRLGKTGLGLGTFWRAYFESCLQPTLNLVFLYRDFGEQIEDPRMFDVTSETVVKHVIIHLWLF